VLLAEEGVAGVAVFGVPDERMGERVAALVETNGEVDVDGLAVACRRQLADYKVPERIQVIEALPRNAMGKVVRTGLADLLEGTT
jgi:acyl-CoA synthetase (AMP-forming)/AMP-acid ligase II